MTSDYPFIQRNKQMRKFKKSLFDFTKRFFKGVQYTLVLDEEFMSGFKAWIVAMSRFASLVRMLGFSSHLHLATHKFTFSSFSTHIHLDRIEAHYFTD
jgi:hypothetical protein